MKAFIFAAGLGTRLKPLTDTVPKALVKVGGATLLDTVSAKLAKAGFDSQIVNVHHHPDKMKSYLAAHHPEMIVSDESDLLRDTGGGIRHAEQLLDDADFFLAHNVDILTDADLHRFTTLRRDGVIATLLVSDRPSSRHLYFDNDMRLRGWINEKTGETRSPFKNFDPDSCKKLAFGGIHLISREIFPLMRDWPEAFSIIDFYLSTADRYPVFGVEQKPLRVLDVGKPETLHMAEELSQSGACFWE
ncbi:MAG: NTP transferase domain-containing protein [Bacteroidales bacterium]|nr:NTP transferase domain-containing protein [Bacteroidales bacterium]